MKVKPQTELEEKIGYHFKDAALLTEALCHSSYANEKRGALRCNERLEFLGDSVLSIVVSNHLFRNCTELPEGELTKIRASLVCEKSLFEWAKVIGLGDFLLLGHGEDQSGGRTRPSDAVIHSICSRYSVSKEWLCTGCGEMLPHKVDEEKLTEWTKALFTDEKASFQQRFALMMADLDPDGWAVLAEILDKLTV